MAHARSFSPCPLGWAMAIASAVLAFDAVAAHGVFAINQPWVRPASRASEAYMVLMSSEAASLTGVRSKLALRATLRGPRSGLSAVALPAGESISLKPGGTRIVLSGLRRPLKLGEHVPLTLIIDTSEGVQEIAIDAEVRRDWPVDAELRAHHP